MLTFMGIVLGVVGLVLYGSGRSVTGGSDPFAFIGFVPVVAGALLLAIGAALIVLGAF